MINFLKWLFLSMIVVMLTACGGGDSSVETVVIIEKPISTNTDGEKSIAKSIDSMSETITQDMINSSIENNEMLFSKDFVLPNTHTAVKVFFNLLENNITEDFSISIEEFTHSKDEIWAKIIKMSSSTTLSNVSIEIQESSNTTNKVSRSIQKNTPDIAILLNIQSTLSEAPIYEVYKTNIHEYIESIKLEQFGSSYRFTTITTEKLLRIYSRLNGEVSSATDTSAFANSKQHSIYLPEHDNIYTVTFGKKVEYPTSMPGFTEDVYTPFISFRMTTDFVGINKAYTVAERNLQQTKSNTSDVLNNFMDTQEHKNPQIVGDTVTHRITDFDKLLNGKSNILPSEWKSSSYGLDAKGDDGRMPLILVHGWNGTIGKLGGSISRDINFRDPSKLLLWENSEFHYWHNFIAYYLASTALQNKYHIYFYRYTSYKHVAHSAKVFKELLDEVSSVTDLGKGLQQEEGVSIVSHSMGGMVSRAMIEEWDGLGSDAEKLKKLITLDTPHHGSVGSMDDILTNTPKDLNTHGAMDLNYDNFDNGFTSEELNKFYNKRRKENGLDNFDTLYCVDKLKYNTLEACMNETANPYMKYVNQLFEDNKAVYNEKYIIYSAWNTHNKFDIDKGIISKPLLDFNKNYLPDLNFIDNGEISAATIYIGNYGYSSGGAESVGSSILASSAASQDLNPKDSTFPTHPYVSDYNLYHVNRFLNDACVEYDMYYNPEGVPVTFCAKRESISVSLITDSIGRDHSYSLPYRLFWDYDHETIFSGLAKGRGNWDKYISANDYIAGDIDFDTTKDTLFNRYRFEYIEGAYKILNLEEPWFSGAYNMNPLVYEPVFMLLKRDLLYLDDLDHDGMPNVWEDEHNLDKYNADDKEQDLDDDGLNNYDEYLYGTNPENNDTDGDDFSDYTEIESDHTDPLLDSSHFLYAPTNFLATRSGESLTLSWNSVANTDDYTLEDYVVVITTDANEEYSPIFGFDAVSHEVVTTSLTLSIDTSKTYYLSLIARDINALRTSQVFLKVIPEVPVAETLTLELLNEQECKSSRLCKFKIGKSLEFDDLGYTIDFGDGESYSYIVDGGGPPSTESTSRDMRYHEITHTYTSNGAYWVSLTLENGNDSRTLTVNAGGSSITFKIKKTGQTLIYDTDGNTVDRSVADANATLRDDGYYQSGVTPNYSRSGDVVTDHITGLEWQDDEEAATVTKQWVTDANYDAGNYSDTSGDTAATYCSNLSLDGGGWRLPTVVELQSIVVDGAYKPSIDTTVFENYFSGIYWSSTTRAGHTYFAFNVFFNNSYTYRKTKGNNGHVRCVRLEQ